MVDRNNDNPRSTEEIDNEQELMWLAAQIQRKRVKRI